MTRCQDNITFMIIFSISPNPPLPPPPPRTVFVEQPVLEPVGLLEKDTLVSTIE